MSKIKIFLNSFLLAFLIDMIYELKFSYRINLIFLDLSLNSYIGILFIIIGLLVRVDLKFSIQKDLK